LDAAARASLPARDGASIRATASEVARLIGARPWWQMFFEEAEESPGPSEEPLPGGDEQTAAPEVTPAAGPLADDVGFTIAACLVVLAGATRGLVEERSQGAKSRQRSAEYNALATDR
jgi:hypothetical protein